MNSIESGLERRFAERVMEKVAYTPKIKRQGIKWNGIENIPTYLHLRDSDTVETMKSAQATETCI